MQGRLGQHLLTAFSFSIAGAAFAWWVTLGHGSSWWWPGTAGLGTFITALTIWPPITRQPTVTRGSLAGALIGLVAHPISAVVTVVVLTPFARNGNADPSAFLKGLTFVTFWWSLLVALTIAWKSAVIGALVGFACTVIPRRTPASHGDRDSRGQKSHPLAGAVSLAIVASCTAICVVTIQALRPPESRYTAVDGPAGLTLDAGALTNDADAATEPDKYRRLTGAEYLGYGAPSSDLTWSFTDDEFFIQYGAEAAPALNYEFQIPYSGVTQVRGRWQTVNQTIIFSDLHFDGAPADVPDVTCPIYKTNDGDICIPAGEVFCFRPKSDED